jgi:hypothetical protein
MRIIAIVIAFAATAAFANPPTEVHEANEATKAMPMEHGKGHAKMKMMKKHETAAAAECTKENEKAGKCKPEVTK